ncbi:hypothetical protein KALB_6359 [Kutzneria albida DSM 43870]|uniref:Uncharacterized protein n=2 Tax=Kutzneria TaxID=43356 RepID=W5WNJ0_9PSEU|nr:hypothetical protein KALB_6359 [Kutzneria albida DSM 43870]
MHMSDMGTQAVSAGAVLVRILLLLAGATIAGIGLVRPAVAEVRRPALVLAWTAAAATVVADVVSIVVYEVNPVFAVVQLVLALAVPPLLRWRSAPAYAGFGLFVVLVSEISLDHMGIEFFADTAYTVAAVLWIGITVLGTGGWQPERLRPKPVALTLAAVLVLAGIVQIAASGVALDRRLYTTGFGLLLIVVAVLPLVVTALVLTRPRFFPLGVTVVVAAYVAWSALIAVPKPLDLPTPGVPLLVSQPTPLLLTPQRPGRNLVHVPAGSVTVRAGDEPPVTAVSRPGADGAWAEVTLPAGRSTLTVERDGVSSTVDVDTGTDPLQVNAVGADGPECAGAALGGLLGGSRAALASCPADELSTEDADSLRSMIGFLASKSVPAITLVGDESPRARAAAALVRANAEQMHIPVVTEEAPNNALLLVSGWTRAATELSLVATEQTERPTFTRGVYLAPWLLTGPLVKSVVSSAVPLRFDPREQRSLNYTLDLASAFEGQSASVAGFQRWLAARGQRLDEPVRIYACAQVDVMQMSEHMNGMDMNYPGQWVPSATVVPISGPLPD